VNIKTNNLFKIGILFRIVLINCLFLAFGLIIDAYGSDEIGGSVPASVDFTVISDWGTGFTGEITITNLSNQTVNNWILEFDYDQNISSLWNGVITTYGSHYTVKHPSWSSNIGTNSSVTFGFVVSGSSSDRPTNYRLNSTALDNTPPPPAPTPTPLPTPTPTPTPTPSPLPTTTPTPTPTPTQIPETPNDDIEFIFTVTDDWGNGFNVF